MQFRTVGESPVRNTPSIGIGRVHIQACSTITILSGLTSVSWAIIYLTQFRSCDMVSSTSRERAESGGVTASS